MTTSLDTPILTIDDVQALRQAGSIAFHYYEGRYYLRAHLSRSHSADEPVVFTEREQRLFPDIWAGADWRARVIEVHQARSHTINYGTGEAFEAYASVSSARFSLEWVTVASLLKPGDVLGIEFVAGNNSTLLTQHGLFADEAKLIVERESKAGKRTRMVFSVDHRICPNNSARMVQVR